MGKKTMVLDFGRCIGCNACRAGCRECGGHETKERVFVEHLEPEVSKKTFAILCMHCEQPACAMSCPTQAIPITPDGTVLSAQKERCIGCRNCTYACPYGIPRFHYEGDIMYKCDMCLERSQAGIPPWCASACPAEAIRFLDEDQLDQLSHVRPVSNRWFFGKGDPVVTHTHAAFGPVWNADQVVGSEGALPVPLPIAGEDEGERGGF